ncbi:MAG: alpha-glucuronidase, partial [Cyclobacteriaceae bacterium]
GLLYGTFEFIAMLQQHSDISDLDIIRSPKIKHRLLNHWDNLDRTVERGYAGFSIWNWHKLPDYIDQRYIDYARANASLGINGTVITNVNANALVLTEAYLEKVAALADAFRPYGIRVYLTARFSAPSEIGGLETSDPLDPAVIQWWKDKADEIYSHIPDFGGFLVKANSEGQPGPQNYGRTHADGANLLADAVAPHGGIVMWRAFVYSNEEPEDRAKQAYNEFVPLDGSFRDNVLIQVKNGAIDFQPREPFHPLFGAMPETPLMMEFQITKEYLGFSTHLAYLAPLFEETLNADTYAKGKGSTVGKVIDGTLHNYDQTGIAGVSNIGTDINWTGSIFGQADWYAFGRLAWDHELSSEQIAGEWIRRTFTDEQQFVSQVTGMMMKSREAVVNYMTPLGLHHLMGWSHHYGPGPWIKDKHRADWTSVYYHRADAEGIGFDRTKTGSDAVSQYFPPVAEKFGNLESCPEEFLLWFHHVEWDYQMKSGRTLWEELCLHYQQGVDEVAEMLKTWEGLEGYVDEQRYDLTHQYLEIQLNEANWWKNACIKYFQTFSERPVPDEVMLTDKSLEYYISRNPLFVPGN